MIRPVRCNRDWGSLGIGWGGPAIIAVLVLGGPTPHGRFIPELIGFLFLGLAAAASGNDLGGQLSWLPSSQTGTEGGTRRLRPGVPLRIRIRDALMLYALIAPGEVVIALTSARWLAWVWVGCAALCVLIALRGAWRSLGS